jgi:hypothetical protein
MPKYVIQREIPGAGKLSMEELRAISQTSCGVLQKNGSSDSVAAQLRDRRQNLMRVYRAE